jgi:hypothetical protein
VKREQIEPGSGFSTSLALVGTYFGPSRRCSARPRLESPYRSAASQAASSAAYFAGVVQAPITCWR